MKALIAGSCSRVKVVDGGRPFAMILDCNEIIANKLWVGCYIRVDEVGALKEMGITTVLSLQSDLDTEEYGIPLKKLLKAYELAGIQLRRIPTQDYDKKALSANLPIGVAELEDALAPHNAKVYLHCTAGVNRGPTLAAAYLMKNRGLSAQGAYEYVTDKRHCNPYLDMLEMYESFVRLNTTGRPA